MNHSSRKTQWICILGFIVSGIFGYLSFRSFQWSTLKSVLSRVEPGLLTLAGFFLMTSILLRAYRWKFFLPRNGGYSYYSLVCGVAIGYFFSNILPGRVGDLLRPGYVSKASNQSFHIIFYSVLMERIFELVILLLFATTLLKYNGVLGDMVSGNFHILYGIAFAGLLLLFNARFILSWALRVSRSRNWNFLSNPISEIVTAFEDNFRYTSILVLILLSFLIFMIDGLVFVCAFDALQLHVSFIGKFTTMVATSLGHLVPSAPAGIGVFHYLCQTSLHYFGVERNVGLSAAILVHAFFFLMDFVIGVYFLVFGPIKLVQIMNRSAASEVQ